MNSYLHSLITRFPLVNSPSLFLALGGVCLLGVLLTIGRRSESVLRLERLGIPIALLVGIGGLVIGPYGFLPLLPEALTDILVHFPTPLLTLVFATLMLGRPIPSREGLIEPVTKQALLGMILGFGQYLIGGTVVLLILIPYLGVDPLMGCLIEVGFEGGHGAAAVMGESFSQIGFSKGLDLGLAMATVGLLSSTFIGSALIIIGRFVGWINPHEILNDSKEEEDANDFSLINQLRKIALNLGLIGVAVLIGLALLSLIRLLGSSLGGNYQKISATFPVFPLALLGSLLVRFLLERFNKTGLVSEIIQREIGILATDLLIATAMVGLNLPLLYQNWFPLLLLGIAGLSWNLFSIFFFAKIAFREKWFERSIIEFGNATGVAASGILLLRLADPEDQSNTLPIFSIKQLFLQPILSGGLVTVIAPIAITSIGLIKWTELCGLITILLVVSGFLFKNKPFQAQN